MNIDVDFVAWEGGRSILATELCCTFVLLNLGFIYALLADSVDAVLQSLCLTLSLLPFND